MKDNESTLFSYLITNKNFRDWVIRPNDERNYFWKKWMDAHPESIADVKKAREFIERMSFKKEQLSGFELDDMLGKIVACEKPLVRSRKPVKISEDFYTLDQWVKVAAILFICLISAILIESLVYEVPSEPEVVVAWKKAENPKGRKSKVFLPDGTIVNLNSGSEILYPEIFPESQRIVELKGEAFFEVARDENKPFIIQTDRMTTEVLGTSFNINARGKSENHSIAVVTGKVKVSNSLGESEILEPNEMIYISNEHKINKTTFDIKLVTGWKDGIISFQRTSFAEIQEVLSMWYGVDFIVDEGFKMENVYTGEFEHETLENVMNGIAFSSGFKYKISGKKVYVNK